MQSFKVLILFFGCTQIYGFMLDCSKNTFSMYSFIITAPLFPVWAYNGQT